MDGQRDLRKRKQMADRHLHSRGLVGFIGNSTTQYEKCSLGVEVVKGAQRAQSRPRLKSYSDTFETEGEQTAQLYDMCHHVMSEC